jgi:hypothetical protein
MERRNTLLCTTSCSELIHRRQWILPDKDGEHKDRHCQWLLDRGHTDREVISLVRILVTKHSRNHEPLLPAKHTISAL